MKSWIGLAVVALWVPTVGRAMDSATLASAPPTFAPPTPAPLYRDPVFDGVADPVLIWNPQRRAWWMYYTQRCFEIGRKPSESHGRADRCVGLAIFTPAPGSPFSLVFDAPRK